MPSFLKNFDWPLLAGVLLLTIVGVMMIYSTGLADTGSSGLWVRQILALCFGMVGLFFFASLDYRFLRKNGMVMWVLSLLLLGGLFLFGAEIRSSHRWYNLWLFNFQPSEFAKLALIIFLAKFFQEKKPFLVKFPYLLWSLIFVILPVALIIVQPDLGSGAVLIAIWLGMLILAKPPRRFFLYLMVSFLVLAAVSWQFFLADYQKDRLKTFLDPTADPLGRGYNVIQSIVAVGSGGVYGRGLARGLQSQLRFLPERQTDFIFASTVEELGLLGGVLVVVLFVFVMFRLLRIMNRSQDLFGMYLAGGIFFLVLTQFVVNVGMNLGLLPVTGITLPFLSYGGSSLVTMLWLIGIALSISRYSAPVRFE